MKLKFLFLIFFGFSAAAFSQLQTSAPVPGYEVRIKNYIDSLRIFDTHEHLIDPEVLKKADFLDFTILLLENSIYDLKSAGMPDTLFKHLYTGANPPSFKWKLIEPWWKRSFNTANNKILVKAINDIYGVKSLDSLNVISLSSKMKKSYGGDWFDHIIRDMCKIDYVIQDGPMLRQEKNYVRHAARFNPWLLVKSKYSVDSLAIMQIEPIYTLEEFVKSMNTAFEREMKSGMAVVKIDVAYARSLSFEKVTTEAARKVFRTLVNGNEDTKISDRDAKPLQDYMTRELLRTAKSKSMPVAFHTGYQAGSGNYISNANPALLANLFIEFPDIRFVLFHASYPYGGELSTLAKSFRNVSIDMNWIYDISPEYATRYLGEWLETVPASKIMAFGGDQRMPEMTYGSLLMAKKVVSDVLAKKIMEGYFTEDEARTVARMILHDNGMEFYNIR